MDPTSFNTGHSFSPIGGKLAASSPSASTHGMLGSHDITAPRTNFPQHLNMQQTADRMALFLNRAPSGEMSVHDLLSHVEDVFSSTTHIGGHLAEQLALLRETKATTQYAALAPKARQEIEEQENKVQDHQRRVDEARGECENILKTPPKTKEDIAKVTTKVHHFTEVLTAAIAESEALTTLLVGHGLMSTTQQQQQFQQQQDQEQLAAQQVNNLTTSRQTMDREGKTDNKKAPPEINPALSHNQSTQDATTAVQHLTKEAAIHKQERDVIEEEGPASAG